MKRKNKDTILVIFYVDHQTPREKCLGTWAMQPDRTNIYLMNHRENSQLAIDSTTKQLCIKIRHLVLMKFY